ncbi:unnamed protein product [Fusarium equiseti]|uniref:Uncharacterized protein n=1 Tax=Fusarium equiseti TaxID=61235 RepID=A0A8J2IU89_FUSEQ|nr:unnamed protein product [Fusarium equiseti]
MEPQSPSPIPQPIAQTGPDVVPKIGMAQRTFTLIPKFPGRDESPDKPPPRPMTSKQVRNAYKAANKGPKLTRAEQWKLEKAEQERIKKEFEREKAAAKAKVARDKKKEKELAEKKEKQKKRLPLVNVRPSQETISWFVRGNGSTKKRDAQGKEVEKADATTNEDNDRMDETTSANDHEMEQPATKLQKLDVIQEDEDEEEFDFGDVGMETRPQIQPPTSPESPRIEAAPQEGPKEDNMAGITKQVTAVVEPQPPPPPRHLIPEIELEGMDDELDEDFEEDLALGILEDIEAAMEAPKPNTSHAPEIAPEPLPKPDSVVPAPPVDNIKTPAPNRYAEDLGLHRPASPTFVKPPFPKDYTRHEEARSSSPPHQEPPMSTQTILYNLDDFFPSSSQQARELEEDLDDDDLMPSAALNLAPIAEDEEEEFEDTGLEKSPEQPRLPVLDPAPDSPPPPPRRFFTSSGSHERMCLALQRSRRTAALEQIQQRERSRIQAGMAQRAQAESRKVIKPPEATRTPHVISKPLPQSGLHSRPPQPPIQKSQMLHEKSHTNTPPLPKRIETPKQPQQPPVETTLTSHNNMHAPKHAEPPKQTPPAPPPQENKENQKPSPLESFALSASQESYGGDWVDDIALELMI